MPTPPPEHIGEAARRVIGRYSAAARDMHLGQYDTMTITLGVHARGRYVDGLDGLSAQQAILMVNKWADSAVEGRWSGLRFEIQAVFPAVEVSAETV